MREEWKKELKKIFSLKQLAQVILGNTIYCLGIAAFVLPLNLITGGTTGIGLIVNYYFGIPIELFAAVFNIVMFALAWCMLGSQFAFSTLVSTLYFPFILGQLQKIEVIQSMTQDPLLGTIFAGLLIGVGLGIVIRSGASTGGVDIPPLVLNKKTGLSVSLGLYVCDVAILGGQMLFRETEKILYGILLIVIYTMVMDKVLVNGKDQMQVKIISDKTREMNIMIHEKLDRGTTFLKAETGYLHKDTMMLMTVVSGRELAMLQREVLEIDSKAFIVISEVKEVLGRGFSLRKRRK